MTRKSILVVCMLDSIHSARWLQQFKDLEVDFQLVSSSKFKVVHPEIKSLIKSKGAATYNLALFSPLMPIYGYIDFSINVFCSTFLRRDSRKLALKRILSRKGFDFIHALEIQHAGYLVSDVLFELDISPPFILTNWGSDIYYFSEMEVHRRKLIRALQKATHYSAECNRDYELARMLGFSGFELPCIPNAGGFLLPDNEIVSLTSSRAQIVAKVYGGRFGRGDLVIKALIDVMSNTSDSTAFLYSVTDDLLPNVEALAKSFPDRIRYSTRKNPLPHAGLLRIFQDSRIYLGASRSDGISTSFLEALVYGCYPIQTDTSCAFEWVSMGAVASVVPQNVDALVQGLTRALSDDGFVDEAQEANFHIAKKYLDHETIKKIAVGFYS